MEFKEYKKYRWFFTKSGKLVIGGKSAEQNDELLRKLKALETNFFVMHTASPGSPFSIIFEKMEKVAKDDLNEAAIFTGCFSRAWRSGAKKAEVHIFKLSDLYKLKSMAQVTWGVREVLSKPKVNLELVLTKQSGILRAVPEQSLSNKKDILLKVFPGKNLKEQMLPKLEIELQQNFSS